LILSPKKREEVVVIGRKKGKMPEVEFNLKVIRQIKKRKKKVCKGNSKHPN
jgi:hypothetical protein